MKKTLPFLLIITFISKIQAQVPVYISGNEGHKSNYLNPTLEMFF